MASTSTETQGEAQTAARDYLQGRLQHAPQAHDDGKLSIPIIDISSSFGDSPQGKQVVARQIHDACVSSGFLFITAHGVPSSHITGVLSQAKRFFKDLPASSKEPLHVRHSPYYYGWEPSESTSIYGDAETKQGFNWGYAEDLDPTGGDGAYVQLDGTRVKDANVWPQSEDLPGFYDGVKAYYSSVLGLARHLSKLFALSLGLPEDAFDHLVTHPGGNARLLHYPASVKGASRNSSDEPDAIGLGAHSDYQCFTILLSSGTPGLEILSSSGQWTAAPAVENALIVNVGDFMMRWTNDLYRSTVHRVVNRTGEERYSVPFFFSINHDELVDVLPSCVTAESPARYPPIKAGEYVLQRLAMTMKDSKSQT